MLIGFLKQKYSINITILDTCKACRNIEYLGRRPTFAIDDGYYYQDKRQNIPLV